MHIEVCCTNKKNQKDIEKYETLGLSAFELDMSQFKEDIESESIRKWILDTQESKTVLNLPETSSKTIKRSGKTEDGRMWILLQLYWDSYSGNQ